ncbi:MAG: ATP-dependent zinc metalloprotease FtsH [Oscillospiraceae bacterium]|nr:ATP-dependent zinc metalloprotease FtsH [Oscillospiraceae bacterium]
MYFIFAAVILLVMIIAFQSMASTGETYSYSEIMSHFDNYEVSYFSLNLGSGELTMTLDSGETITYDVPSVNAFYNELFSETNNYRDEYNATHSTPLEYDLVAATDSSFWLNLIPTLLMIGVMIFLVISMSRSISSAGKIGSVGKANVKVENGGQTKVTFEDVAGADEEKAELQEIVELLKDPKKYQDIGAKIPKGVLLVGPPGNGKTLLAKAVAGEAGVPFFSISGSDFLELYVGVGAARVRDLFDQAKKASPSIIFIDEIDAVGRRRGTGLGGGHDEREQTLNQLLVEMDGFEGNTNVIVMAATNRKDVLDPALLRPGRFDRQVYVNYPDIKGREAILKVHSKNKPLAPDVDLHTVAAATVGFTGADLANLVNEAALLAVKSGRKAITAQDLNDASIKVIAGPEKKSKVVTEHDKKITAYHESGHAICHYYCPTQDKVQEISIIPRGQAGGYTMALPDHDKAYATRKEMSEEIITLLGGRAAEKVVLDDISTGASNDLERATSIARSMVTQYGFSDKIGPVVYGRDDDEVFLGRDYNSNKAYSEVIASEIDEEVRSIIHGAYDKAQAILTEHIAQLHTVAGYLYQHEKVTGEQFILLMQGINPDDPTTPELPDNNPTPELAPAQ